MRYAYYPGCSLETSAKEYDTSVRAVFGGLGIELVEIEDWSCCGSSATHKVDEDLAALVAARNLSLAKQIGNIVAPCASCFSNLKEASIKLDKDSTLREALALAGYTYQPGSVKVLSAVEALSEAVKAGALKDRVKSPLDGLKVASYYGCLLVRPPEIAGFDDPENPSSMDELAASIGAEAIEWSHKTECCGNSFVLVDKDMTQRLVVNILNAAIDAGADVISCACPLCQQNLNLRQHQLEKGYGLKRKIPVVYFTELMSEAMGAGKLNLDASTKELIKKRHLQVKEAG